MYKKAFRLGVAAMLLVAGLSVTNQTLAIGNGPYLGIMFGPATNTGGTVLAQQKLWMDVNTNYTSTTTVEPSIYPGNQPIFKTPVSPSSKQFLTRFYFGNQFNRYAAFELGLNYFTSIDYDSKNVQLASNAQVTIRNFDLSLVGLMPFGNSFNLSARGGIALIYETVSGAFNNPGSLPSAAYSPGSLPGSNCGASSCVRATGRSSYNTLFRPVIGLGASYEVTQNWMVDFLAMQIMTGGQAGNVRFMALGISYHFADRYCGQFLCDN